MNGKWKSIFEMICVSIIYRVRIISTANIQGRFIVSDKLSPLNAYQIVNDISVMSDRYIYIFVLSSVQSSHNSVPSLSVKFITVIIVITHTP